MARGSWHDFTSKYGFADGAATDYRDWNARRELVALLNKTKEYKSKRLRAVVYDKAGFHNSCLIQVVKVKRGDSMDLSQDYDDLTPEYQAMAEDAPEPENVWDLIARAYAMAETRPHSGRFQRSVPAKPARTRDR